jgi:1,4-alpha-glucan branching enzyme
MIGLIGGKRNFQSHPVEKLWEKDDDQVLAFKRGDLVFVFNFNPMKSFADYGILAPEGEYSVLMSTDDPEFGGHGNISMAVKHFTMHDELYSKYGVSWLKLYLPARTAMVLKLKKSRKPVAKKAAAKKCATKKTAAKKSTAKKTTTKKTK